ncbi:[protein-PII] uridylyltransferase [Psychromarinibacter halotolerans]|uniref:Bifunctional uridylyltransferase/uridylyl-removing enzyme n=1 Tax=Psychromarinibacter halotolerans TaxID=1775175 RepID=A0ABV7GKU2_9RHOB|nr:[protein-PII] uridylyltransferase [Psychromarinibacter halotolerans]MDF0595507.1 [protein-PII] uridylyltransferase [Psychromarinibacter halotolerans]
MTPPPEASLAPASDRSPARDHVPGPADQTDDLILPAAQVFDADAVRGRLDAACRDAADAKDIRAAAVTILGDAMREGRDAIAAAFRADPMNAWPTVHAYSHLTDGIVTSVFRIATQYIHPLANPTEAERIAVLAVGGYGRAEMAPYSDVDLLFLTPYKITPWAESVIESMLYIFWDLHLKVGHASRTVKDCLRLAKDDYTIRTALLEHRFIDGFPPLETELKRRLCNDLFKGTAAEFIEAKLDERAKRHRKQGGQRYMVEPNVKEGKGGLRDLQSLFWIDKYVHGVESAADLVELGVFRQAEYDAFLAAEDFLMAVRCHLHLITNRAMDQLTFDMQVEVADAMGYVDAAGRPAVEIFMQDYFRHATEVGEVTRIFLTALEERHVKREPKLVGLFKRRRKVRDGYKIVNNRLAVADEAAFLSDKLNLLRIFEEGLRTGLLIHPDAMRLVAANLKLIDDDMRSDKEATRIFRDLLLKHGNPERALRRMNELGVLGTFIPEFAPIVAMMQFNMYHSYTVDEHTIQCISTLAQIERGELIEELPVASRILEDGVNRRVLYVALLCHDIGKGRDEDHSVVGAKLARTIAPRLGLKPGECVTVEWLVRYHLLMSDMAQKRDIADPRTVRDFAKAVQTKERLDLLTVLTVCDIRGVGPNVWNNWKAALLRGLYRQTARAMEDGLEALNRGQRSTEAKRNLREALDGWENKAIKAEIDRHYEPYWQGLHVTAHVDFAELLRGLGADELRLKLTPDEDRDATRVTFALADHPGIFSRLCGALALVGANIKDARTFTTKDGWVTAAFWIQDGEGSPYEASRLPRLRQMIEKTLRGEVRPTEAMRQRDKLKKREAAFRVPTSVVFDNEGSEIYTIIEVDTRDRPGLLYDLTRTLAADNIQISSAVIATYGEQVVDSFYVKDMFGLKLYSENRQRSLEKKLRHAIEQGAIRAKEA